MTPREYCNNNPPAAVYSDGMTGVTVPEWGAILMLRSLKSPESYFQAAFRVQSPWAMPRLQGDSSVRVRPFVAVGVFPAREIAT